MEFVYRASNLLSNTENSDHKHFCDEYECELRTCKRCKQTFCGHYASPIDFTFCAYCMHDVVLEDSVIKKQVTTFSLTGKKKFTHTMTARHLVFKGEDWMFAQRRILSMDDNEIETTIEYHRAIMGELLDEREARKIAANKAKLAKVLKGMSGASFKIPAKMGLNTDGSIIGTEASVVTETTIKKTKISATQTNSAQVAITAIVNMLKAQGKTSEQISAALINMANGK